jgi:type 1 glutamine amidotransferase
MLRAIACLICMLTMAGMARGEETPAAAKINVILLTGSDVGVHPWKENAPFVRETLEASGKFTVRVDEGVKILETREELAKFDLIVIIGRFESSGKFALTDGAKANFVDFVKEGKGFYCQHYATASWGNWAEFEKICGKRWVNGKSGHNARSVFEVKISDAEHPIVKGLKDFKTDDELYARLVGADADIHAVATAESDFSKKTEPIVFTHEYGKGRVVINNLGHDKKAMDTPEVKAIIVRCAEFAATGKVADEKK